MVELLYETCWMALLPKFAANSLVLPKTFSVLPGKRSFVCSLTTTFPFSGMKRTMRLISFWSPPASSHGSQML